MASYYVNRNKQANGDNEVHVTGCRYMPLEMNRTALGDYTNCVPAVQKAKSLGYPRANGCKTCCFACHTS